MIRIFGLPLVLAFFFLAFGSLFEPSVRSDENRVQATIQRVGSAFRTIEDYTCEVDQIFFQNDSESQRYRFKFYFKRKKKIRVDFSSPYPSLTILYRGGDREATIMPFRSLPALKFRLSIDNPTIKTLSGQRIDQSDMGYFIEFVFKNLSEVKQGEEEFYEDEGEIRFLLRAMDYIDGKRLEKYRISISKKIWLPFRIERLDLGDHFIEISDIGKYKVNTHLEDKFFSP